MGDYPRWAEPFLFMYADSPIATSILNDRLEGLWENKTMQNDQHLVCRMNLQDCLSQAGQNGLAQRFLQGKPFTYSVPGMLSVCSAFVFQPRIAASGALEGVLVHYWGENSTCPPPSSDWRSSLYQPISIFSHQFRTPLSQIFSALNLLQIDRQQDQTLQTYLRSIHWSCYRLLRTVSNFSSDQQIQSGQLKPKCLRAICVIFFAIFARMPNRSCKTPDMAFFAKCRRKALSLYTTPVFFPAFCAIFSPMPVNLPKKRTAKFF